MKTIVHVQLPGQGQVLRDPRMPLGVYDLEHPERSGFYEQVPSVFRQLAPGETAATFEAEWIGGQWVFGKPIFALSRRVVKSERPAYTCRNIRSPLALRARIPGGDHGKAKIKTTGQAAR